MKRLPIIRHIRALWLSYRVHRFAQQWGRMGIGFGYPNEADLRHLQAIWRGEA